MRNLVFTWFIILVVMIINLFFYSFITISLYKLICYESKSINVFLENIYYNKSQNIFYNLEDVFFINILGYKWNTININTVYLYNNNIIFYDLIINSSINTFLFVINNNNYIVNNDELNLIFLNFYIRSSNLNWINCISLQKTIIINLNESGIFFFRIYNPSHVNVKLVTLYMIYPNIVTLYVNKIQCFCFNIIFLKPLELVDLPVLIYIHPFLSIVNNLYISNIIIYYIVFLN